MKIAVLGGGISGLSAAWKLGLRQDTQISVYEKADRIGGVCGYHEFEGLRMDLGAHKIYSLLPGIMDEFKELGGERLIRVKKDHRIIIRKHLLDYPVKFGQLLPLFSPFEIVKLGLSIMETMIKTPFVKKPVSYEEYCVAVFGKEIYRIVFQPLAEKAWGDPRTLSADIARTRIPTKNIFDLLFRVIGLTKETKDTNAEYMLYPKRGFYDICECMAERIVERRNTIHNNCRPEKINIKNNKIESVIFAGLGEVKADLIVSTIPLDELFMLLYPDRRGAVDFIPMRHSIIVYFAVNKPKAINNQWIFCADKELLFSRITEQKLISSEYFPKDKTIISCDFTCDADSAISKENDESIAGACIEGLEKLQILKKADVTNFSVLRLPYFYPVYRIGYEEILKNIVTEINKIENIITSGRLGLSTYINIDHCLDMSNFIASSLLQNMKPSDINSNLLKMVWRYRIVD